MSRVNNVQYPIQVMYQVTYNNLKFSKPNNSEMNVTELINAYQTGFRILGTSNTFRLCTFVIDTST
jgi:hypothetical protein